MKKYKVYILLIAVASLSLYVLTTSAKEKSSFQLPEFTQTSADQWINSAPLTRSDLQGKVVLIDVWSYGCWNCYRSFPWIHSLEKRFAKDEFIVVGIHSPEFDREKKRENVVAKTKEFAVTNPVMLDNDFAYWTSLGNQYWPTFYVVDKQGHVRGKFIGETHQGDARAKQAEQIIAELLTEKVTPDS
jgi:thiol-disulfide isomerase/thioredoxin